MDRRSAIVAPLMTSGRAHLFAVAGEDALERFWDLIVYRGLSPGEAASCVPAVECSTPSTFRTRRSGVRNDNVIALWQTACSGASA